MRIAILYKDHRFEEFDASTLTAGDPYRSQGKNILTDWILHLDNVTENGVVLVQHWYNANPNSNARVTLNGLTIPVATRTPGYAILLVAVEELDNLVWLTKDGEKVLWREGNELINGERFFAMEQLYYSDAGTKSINQRAITLFNYLKNAYPERSDEDIATDIGYTLTAIHHIEDSELAQADDNDLYTDPDETTED